MSVGAVGSGGAAFSVPRAGQAVDPQARQAQVNAQADLLLALKGVQHGAQMVTRLSDGAGIDVYV